MANLNGFDANTVEPSQSFDPIPTGKYIAMITESELKTTKSGAGQYLQLTFDIIDGQYRGRKLWARLNLNNPNAKTVQIARGELSAICRAVGIMQPRDSAELHNLPLSIKVVCKNRKDTGEIVNEIKGYEKKEAALASPAPSSQSTPSTSVSAPPNYDANTPAPWGRFAQGEQ